MDIINSDTTSEDEQIGEAASEFFAAISRGEEPSISQFIERYPGIADHIRQAFPALLLVGSCSTDGHRHEFGPQNDGSRTLGDFRLVCEIGRGGMGTVFEAEQISMGRRVALKVLPFAALVHENSMQRFRNEVRAAAALNHPHIVPVYSIGEERGVHFYAMQLIRGRTLADLIGESRRGVRGNEVVGLADSTHPTAELTPPPSVQQALISTAVDSRRDVERYRTAARLGIQAAEALQHAHDQCVLHRDIKPGNLLLDVEGKLYVTDFGLARIEADAGMTMTGDIVGTLRYMAPEQALAKRVVIDHRSDIYSLGVTLYELLALQPAFGETDRSELLKQIAFEEPRPLRKVDRYIPAELETIVLKAIAKNPDDRYPSAQQLADDFRAYLEYRTITAKPPTLLNRMAKWSRRHVAAVWAALAILLISTVVLAVASLRVAKWYHEAEQQREFARAQLKEAQNQEQSAKAIANFLQQMLASANPSQTKGANYTVRQLLDDFSSGLGNQLVDQPLVEARLRQVVGKAYRQLGILDQAELHLKKALELYLAAGGPDSMSVGYVERDYAWSLYESGKHGQAFTYVQEAIDIYRRNGSPREPMLEALSTLQTFLNWNDRFQEADAVAKDALALAGDLDSADVSSVAAVVHSVASAKLRQGDYVAAELMSRRAVDLNRRLSGGQHPNTAWGLTGLGLALSAQNKFEEAETAQREALTIFRKYFGAEHKSVYLVTIRLAKVLAARKDASGSKLLRDETIAGCKKAIHEGKADADGLNVVAQYLATADCDQFRDGREAIAVATKACEIGSYKNADHVDTLAAAYAETGDFTSAVKWSEKSLELTANNSERIGLTKHLNIFRGRKPLRE